MNRFDFNEQKHYATKNIAARPRIGFCNQTLNDNAEVILVLSIDNNSLGSLIVDPEIGLCNEC